MGYKFGVYGSKLVSIFGIPLSSRNGDEWSKSCDREGILREAGGINLNVSPFCIRTNRVTMTTQGNYRLFYEVIYGQQVPTALVVKHPERQLNMVNWWTRNHGSTAEVHHAGRGLDHQETEVLLER